MAVFVFFAAGLAVLAVLNAQNAAVKKQLQDDAEFLIISGDIEHKITMAEFQTLELHDIQANYKKSGKAPETRVYTGIAFANVLQSKNISTNGISKAVFGAADLYHSALSIDDALDIENCFIVIKEDGKPLGKRADGGTGPFRMILATDQFSQRWCSFLTEVTLT